VLTDWREIPLEALERKEIRQALGRSGGTASHDLSPGVHIAGYRGNGCVRETAQALEISANVVKVRL